MHNAFMQNQTALISGASKGIGEAMALALAQQGVKTALLARDETSLTRVQQAIQGLGGQAMALQADVGQPQQVQQAVDQMVTAWGRIDILVNNAGVGYIKPVAELSLAEWDQTISTNLSGVFYLTKACLPHMGPGGHIVNVGSLASKNAFAGGVAYNASKFGLLGFSEALMQDLRGQGIRVSTLLPGSTNTTFGQKASAQANWKIQPSDVAEALLYLLRSDPRITPGQLEIRPSQPPK